MSVWIKQVTIKNLGPIDDLNVDLRRFNLFYGHNETGKTFLTEFMLSSIFRDAHEKNWSVRPLNTQGKVVVSGLEDDDVDFLPNLKKKIEDYWTESDKGLPLNMARLLVVKGGELALSPGKSGGVDRDVLKSALSQDIMFDQILDKIPRVVQSCSLNKGEIEGRQQGKIKNRENINDEKRKLNSLLEKVNQEYTTGGIRDLEIQRDEIQSALDLQEQAKRFKAYQISQEIFESKQKLDKLEENDLEKLRDNIRDHKRLSVEVKSLGEKLKQKKALLQHLNWLKEAEALWNSMSLGDAPRVKRTLLILGAVFSFLGLGLAFISGLIPLWSGFGKINVFLLITAGIMFILGGTMLGFYIWNLHRRDRSIRRSEERNEIEKEYKTRFNRNIDSLAGLREHLNDLKAIEVERNTLEDQQQEKKEKISELVNKIQAPFFRILDKEVLLKEWHSTLENLRNQVEQINKALDEKRLELTRMFVEESEYRTEPAEAEFDVDSYEELQEELKKVNHALDEAKSTLNSLKQKVCYETDDDQSVSWSTLLQHLRDDLEETTGDYKSLTAEILAGIGMNCVLQDIRAQEDEKINRDLKSKEVIEALYNFTGHLNQLDLDGDRITAKDDYGIYPLEELSTGAREQVQLALRLGIASRVSGGEPMFMILDDAFQHSDWMRREKLINTIIQMAKSGWQMIYLTMDDHIRKIASEKGKEEMGKEFLLFEFD